MGHTYQAVQWNPQKKRYDQLVVGGVLLYLGSSWPCQPRYSPRPPWRRC